jgi:hypothetical protein
LSLWPGFLPQPDARLLAVGELDAGGLESQNDLRDRVTVRRLVCGSAGSRYNRAEIAALSAIRRSLNLPSSETFPVYRRCRAIIEAWREWTAQEDAEKERSGYEAADRAQTVALRDLNHVGEQLAMTPALTIDGLLAKARAFGHFSVTEKLEEMIEVGSMK